MTETTPANGSSATGGGKTAPKPFYADLESWVNQHFLPIYRRPLGGEFRGCALWWQHAEAIMRLTALWHAWETLRRQPGTGMATWLRDHLDHHLPILLSRTGPFAQCSEDEHIQPRQPRAEQPPPHWWDAGGAVVHGGAAVPTAPEGPAEPEIAHEPGE